MATENSDGRESKSEVHTPMEYSKGDAERIETQANTNAVSRAIAVIILMLIPGVAGGYLDRRLGTQFFVLIGFAIGIGIAIFGLSYVARIADVAAKKSRDLRKINESKSEPPSRE